MGIKAFFKSLYDGLFNRSMHVNVHIRVKHFNQAVGFYNSITCPLAVAAREHFKTTAIKVGIRTVTVDGVVWDIEDGYYYYNYDMDRNLAAVLDDENKIVRTIKLSLK